MSISQQRENKIEVQDEDTSVTIPLEIWEQGILGSEELEAKIFKLLRSILMFSDTNSNRDLLKEACVQVAKVGDMKREINDHSDYFKTYGRSCPRTIIKKYCGALGD